MENGIDTSRAASSIIINVAWISFEFIVGTMNLVLLPLFLLSWRQTPGECTIIYVYNAIVDICVPV